MIARFASLLFLLSVGNLASAFVAPVALTLQRQPLLSSSSSSSSSLTSLDVLARYRNNYYQDTDREYDINAPNRYYNNNDSYYNTRGNGSRNTWYDGTASTNSLATQRDQYRVNQYGRTSVSNGRPYLNPNYAGGNSYGYNNNGYNTNSYDNYYYRPNSYNTASTSSRNGYSVYNNDYAADSMVDHELAKIRNKGRFAIENELYQTYGVTLSHETTKDELALYLLKCRLGQNPMGNNSMNHQGRTRYNNINNNNSYGSGYGSNNYGYDSGHGNYGRSGYGNKYSNTRYGGGNWVDNASDNYWRN